MATAKIIPAHWEVKMKVADDKGHSLSLPLITNH